MGKYLKHEHSTKTISVNQWSFLKQELEYNINWKDKNFCGNPHFCKDIRLSFQKKANRNTKVIVINSHYS